VVSLSTLAKLATLMMAGLCYVHLLQAMVPTPSSSSASQARWKQQQQQQKRQLVPRAAAIHKQTMQQTQQHLELPSAPGSRSHLMSS
jgi:hypothetical protein